MTAANEVILLPRQGHIALDPRNIAAYSPADLMDCIASKSAALMQAHPGGAKP